MTTIYKQFVDDEARTQILNQLRNNENGVTIVFTKADGTERTMLCTLKKIPISSLPKREKAPTASDKAIRVFDLDISEWRSFRWDTLKKVVFKE